MKQKHWIILAVLALVIGAAYFLFFKKDSSAGVGGTIAPGVNPAWEAYVQQSMAWMKNDKPTVKLLTDKAKSQGRTYQEQLRLDAEWYADQKGIPRTL